MQTVFIKAEELIVKFDEEWSKISTYFGIKGLKTKVRTLK